ncbi:hypothetical protein LPJ78_002904 [Coemansia sp. RSA 989]|nr:hypothetical protein BX667DRAFT_513655 [Coemansia mojavensis]KAJ1741649.1 hypothetical protein LPJ68_002672 [Coemansia sp. RSA 1086]KAJ1750403.1 hypothetical protein LPJ79_002912 [Coemansia sp. RSA 1821]KAJ1865104.1 hypothetical protein LPJ78_002904 [Coemansia sp. RSA 989]KAJ1874986.1 hypothetical protein LPJ55_001061 [Coemansia sp. RSA 990]KAJ2627883.1 hypothetical protein H4R22_004177 [Coemansia sp. RSA 1290]KAJ2652813.1 hypothetical protein IWW40_000926 [Coemansia sp. RSA 1250]KAJ26754
MLFSKGRLQVIPDTPDVVVRGSSREARCAMVGGRILLATKVRRTVASLVVRFRAKHEELFNPAMSVAWQPEITSMVVKDGYVCAGAVEMPFDELAGQQEWRFSMGIPGNIGETVFTPSAFIAYELVAEMRVTSMVPWSPFTRQISTVPVAVKRVPAEDSLWAALAAERLDVSATWRDRLELSAAASSRVINDSGSFDIAGVLRPRVKGLRLIRAAFELRETILGPFDCHSDGTGNTTVPCSRELSLVVPDACIADGMHMQTAFAPTIMPGRSGVVIDQEIRIAGALNVPQAYDDIQYDIAAGPIRVSHEIVFVVQIVEETGEVHSVRLSTGVYVLPLSAAPASDLPRYEHSAKDVLLAAGRLWTCSELPNDGSCPPPAYSPPSCTIVTVSSCNA